MPELPEVETTRRRITPLLVGRRIEKVETTAASYFFLTPPAELEDPRPPRFAQGIGLVLSVAGVVLHLVGVPWALAIAAGFIVVASFLNAVVNLCLGCQLYLLLARAGILGRESAAA